MSEAEAASDAPPCPSGTFMLAERLWRLDQLSELLGTKTKVRTPSARDAVMR